MTSDEKERELYKEYCDILGVEVGQDKEQGKSLLRDFDEELLKDEKWNKIFAYAK